MKKPDYKRTEPADGPLRTFWRAIRDAGTNGMTAAQLGKRFGDLPVYRLGNVLHVMKTNGYAKLSDGRGSPYVVDIDCKVPMGESCHLGPGWGTGDGDEETERELDNQARAVGSQSAAGADLQSAWAGRFQAPTGAATEAPESEVAAPVRALVATLPSDPGALIWKSLVMPEPLAEQHLVKDTARPFRSALRSDGTLQLQLKSGMDIDLAADETRELFAWLDRLQGAGLAGVLPDGAPA